MRHCTFLVKEGVYADGWHVTKKFASLGLLSIMLLYLGGCAHTIPLNYAPSSVLTASGAVTVSDFRYLPAEKGIVEPNVIRNTALGTPRFEQNIGPFFRDAVFKELRFVGIKTDGKDRILMGEITEFLIDDLGFSVDWILQVHYYVKSAQGGQLYDCEKITRKKSAKFANPFGAINETIKLNVDELIKEPGFIESIK